MEAKKRSTIRLRVVPSTPARAASNRQIGSFTEQDIDLAIHRLWSAGKRQQALDALRPLVTDKKSKRHMVQLAMYHYLAEQPAEAIALFLEVDKLFGRDAKIIHAISSAYAQNKQYSEAITWAMKALGDYPNDISLNSILAQSHGSLGNLERARRDGVATLLARDAAESVQAIFKGFTLPAPDAEAVRQRLGKKQVVSFSLYGANQRYLRGALHNVLLCMELYPGWTMRFYVDDSVPAPFLDILRDLHCEVLVQASGQPVARKLCWRFLVADDPDVGRYLVRDCDSVVSAREVGTVRDWLESGRLFHVIRDWPTHTDLMLAGLWGGVAGVLPPMSRLKDDFITRYNIASLNIDQIFLGKYLWPVVKASCLVSDGLFRCLGAHPIRPALHANEETIGKNRHATAQVSQANFLKA